jgi:acylphosphatase
MKSVWFRVTGHVQGVGFRHFVREAAQNLDVRGEVWNTRDGAVEGRAQGENIEQFLPILDKGPGRVEGVVTEPTEPLEYSDFSISSTR